MSYTKESSSIRLAVNLRRLRKANGLTQEKLAELANLHLVYISMIERSASNISIESLDRLAIALNCDISDLLRRLPFKGRE